MNSRIETGPGEVAAKLARAHAVATHPDTSISPDNSPFIGAEVAADNTEKGAPGSGLTSYTQLLGGAALEKP